MNLFDWLSGLDEVSVENGRKNIKGTARVFLGTVKTVVKLPSRRVSTIDFDGCQFLLLARNIRRNMKYLNREETKIARRILRGYTVYPVMMKETTITHIR